MHKDASGNAYIDLDNIRITYVPADRRSTAKNWAGQDVLRVCAKRGNGNSLHRGAEFPITGPAAVLRFIEGLCRLCLTQRGSPY